MPQLPDLPCWGADDPQGKAVLFSMTSSEDFVILNGQWVKVGQVIRQRQNTQPSAKVAYHETRENVKAEDPTYLVLERVNDIYVVPGKTHVEAVDQEKGQENQSGGGCQYTELLHAVAPRIGLD